MQSKSIRKEILLDAASISSIIEDMEAWMQKNQIQQTNALRLMLTMEEILLRWQACFGKEQLVNVSMGSKFGTLSLSMSLRGEPCNPLDYFDDSSVDVMQDSQDLQVQILANLGLSPIYAYRKGLNIIDLKLKRQKNSPVATLLLSILASLLLGIVGITFIPEQAAILTEQLLIPIRITLMEILMAVAVPMVFFSILQGICGTGDFSSLSSIGKRMISRFLVKIAIFTALAGLCIYPLFSVTISNDSNITGFSAALQMVLDIVPNNIIEPFVAGNALQAIVIAVIAGIAILSLDTSTGEMRRVIDKITSIFYLIMEWVSTLIPMLVFLLLVETIWSGNVFSLLTIWKPIIIMALVSVMMIFVELLTVSIRCGVSPMLLIKKILPSNLIAFTTSCALATYSVTMDCCEKQLGVNKKIIDFGIPLGLVVYMPAVSFYYLLILFYGLEQYNISCSLGWLLIAWLTVSLLSIATPPISGGTMACFAILLQQMGIPGEAIVFALAMNILADRFCAVADLSMLEMEMILLANKMQLLDRDALREKNY